MSSNKQITSTVTDAGKLEIAITESERPIPGDDEVLIQIEATPINPSDLGLLIGPGDINTLKVEGSKIIMDVPKAIMGAMKPRLNKPMPVGNEGSGVVIEAGANAQELMGKVVSVVGGGMYSQYRCLPAASCERGSVRLCSPQRRPSADRVRRFEAGDGSRSDRERGVLVLARARS